MKRNIYSSFEDFERDLGDGNASYEVVTIIDYPDKVCADLQTVTKSVKVALNRFFKQLVDFPCLYGFKEGWEEELKENGFIMNYSGQSDIERGCWSYSWGIEQNEDNIYIFLNVAK